MYARIAKKWTQVNSFYASQMYARIIKMKVNSCKLIICITDVPYTAEYNPQEYKTRTPTFDPKILEKMDFVSIHRTPNSAF